VPFLKQALPHVFGIFRITIGSVSRIKRSLAQRRGIPQGSPISPLLANLYMRRFVFGWRKLGRGEQLAMGVKRLFVAGKGAERLLHLDAHAFVDLVPGDDRWRLGAVWSSWVQTSELSRTIYVAFSR
jgi:hypothetical protein